MSASIRENGADGQTRRKKISRPKPQTIGGRDNYNCKLKPSRSGAISLLTQNNLRDTIRAKSGFFNPGLRGIRGQNLHLKHLAMSRNIEVKEGSYLSELVVGEAADERRLADLGVADDDHRTLHPRSHRRRGHRAARAGKLDRRYSWRRCCSAAEIPIGVASISPPPPTCCC